MRLLAGEATFSAMKSSLAKDLPNLRRLALCFLMIRLSVSPRPLAASNSNTMSLAVLNPYNACVPRFFGAGPSISTSKSEFNALGSAVAVEAAVTYGNSYG